MAKKKAKKSKAASARPLQVEVLRRRCDAAAFGFDTTASLPPLDDGIVGQDRAVGAIQFGMRVAGEGYNVFAFGPGGTGKLSAARELLAREAAVRPVPDDWCYVHNFRQPHKPQALRLPAGTARQLKDDLDRLIDDLLSAIPAAFSREDAQSRKAEIEEEFQERQHDALAALREEALRDRIMLVETATGFAFAPMDAKGEAMSPASFHQLPQSEQDRIKKLIETLQEKLQQLMRQFPAWFKEMREQLRALSREIATFAVGNLVDALIARYSDFDAIVQHLNEIRADVIENVDEFLTTPTQELLSGHERERGEPRQAFQRYRANLFVDNADVKSAPVVYEDLPTHTNLIGRTEYRSKMGTLVTDFTLIKPGALHLANGGYLILHARQVLMQPFAWDALKRALRGREIRIESLERIYGLLSTISLEPEPIPLDVKLVLIGEPLLYYLLRLYDPEFEDLFKVAADFDDRVERDAASDEIFARLFAGVVSKEGLRHMDREAVGLLIEQCSRIAHDAERLSTDLRSINDLIREADHWAGVGGRELISGADVAKAIDERIYRLARVREHIHDAIERGTILIATDGDAVGQINGLSVIDLGGFAFGQPSRITARTRLGDGKVLDIEREIELGGAIHSKGVLILSNFLSSRYALGQPLSMSASLVFEQSYGMVDGDSASLAELCALLSSLADTPIGQRFAVTGSVNQLGQVQAIGGVNEKIEGFFDVCRRRGLVEGQAVIIPEANRKHLMLREDVVAAAAAGEFAVYAVATVDEAMELLTGKPAGARDKAGKFPDGTVNARVEDRLLEYSRQRQDFVKRGNGRRER